jgi:hypothetical protein
MNKEAMPWGVAWARLRLWALLSRLVFLGAISVLGWTAFVRTEGAWAAECPNAMLRASQSATFLTDCRAYELVSPPEGVPQLALGTHYPIGARASSAGNRIAWYSFYPLSSSLGGEFYKLSTRGPGGWSTEPVGPGLSPTSSSSPDCLPQMFFSNDLSQGILTDGRFSPGPEQAGDCPGNDPPLVAGEPEGSQNLFLRDTATGAYTLVDVTPQGAKPNDAWFQDASNDFSHLVFEDDAKLTTNAPPSASLYEWVSGAVSLVTVLPNGTPTVGSLPGAVTGGGNFRGTAPITHPVSADGTRVIFESEGKLFLRENVEQGLESAPGPGSECANACTVQLDASLGGGGSFIAADTSDTKVYLTDGSGASQRLYEYDTLSGRLNDLTPAGALGLDGLSGISDDGSYLYLVAQAALDAEATAGQPNLYVFHDGSIKFIATLEPLRDSRDWTPTELTGRASPNGRYLGFNSVQSLTGYDNTPVQSEDCAVEGVPGCEEIFLYDAQQNELRCVSCASSGVRPTASAELPGAESASDGVGPVYIQRSVLDDGHVFFDTASPLLRGAANGVSNVYEYQGEHLSLISTGISESNAFFYDANSTGSDVYFVTTQHLVRNDSGNGMRLYDARIDGGFPEAELPQPCSGEGCIVSSGDVLAAPTLPTTGLQGSGNLVLSKHKVMVLTRRQKLERALRVCQRKKNKRKRASCKRQAHRRYAVSSKVKRGAGK